MAWNLQARAGEVMDKLLTVEQAADILGTGVRFPRRLIAERRIDLFAWEGTSASQSGNSRPSWMRARSTPSPQGVGFH